MRSGTAVRRSAVVVCVVIVSLLVPTAVVGGWLDRTVSDTDRYVATVGPLAEDPAVQDAVADLLADRVMAAVDDAGVLRAAVRAATDLAGEVARGAADPGAGRALTRRLAALMEDLVAVGVAGVRQRLADLVSDLAHRITASEQFAQAWRTANEQAHEQLVSVLEGRSDLVTAGSDGTLRLDLATLVLTLRQALVDAGFTVVDRLPPITATYPLVDRDQVEVVRDGYRVLDRALWWALVAALLGAAVALALTRHRRRTASALALGSLGALVLVLVGVAVGRDLAVHALPGPGEHEAASAVVDIVTDRLRLGLRVVAATVLLLAVVLLTTGRRARGLRAAVRGALRWRGTPVVAGVSAVLVLGWLLVLDPGATIAVPALGLVVALAVIAGGGIAVARRTGTRSEGGR